MEKVLKLQERGSYNTSSFRDFSTLATKYNFMHKDLDIKAVLKVLDGLGIRNKSLADVTVANDTVTFCNNTKFIIVFRTSVSNGRVIFLSSDGTYIIYSFRVNVLGAYLNAFSWEFDSLGKLRVYEMSTWANSRLKHLGSLNFNIKFPNGYSFTKGAMVF